MTPINNILLVESDSHNIDVILKHFGKLTCNIKTVRSAVEAWTILFDGSNHQEETPELILLALRFAEGDGLGILRRLRSRKATREIPVIIFTDSILERHVLETFDLGLHSFVVEPVTYAKLFYALTFVGVGINRSALFRKSSQSSS